MPDGEIMSDEKIGASDKKKPLFVKLNHFDARADGIFQCDDVSGPDGGYLLLMSNSGTGRQKVRVINLSRLESFETYRGDSVPDDFKMEKQPRSSNPVKI